MREGMGGLFAVWFFELGWGGLWASYGDSVFAAVLRVNDFSTLHFEHRLRGILSIVSPP